MYVFIVKKNTNIFLFDEGFWPVSPFQIK